MLVRAAEPIIGPDKTPIGVVLVSQHLGKLEARRYEQISREEKQPVEAIYEALKQIQRLEPRPGRPFVEEEPIELSGDFAQAPMTLVVSCPTGEVGRCDEQVAAFTDRVTALHAGPVTVVRAEVSDTAVAAWLAGA